jgi:hypothetical protein
MSEIWNEFEKIAVEQGLIAEAQEDERTERPQEDASKMPARYDSFSNDAIRLLYGLKPESIFEKDKTMIEVAHPETAVAGRAYDAMNAVWENEHQRHDMMAYIALKMPNGHLTQRRYVAAKGDLVNALVRSAFTLDNQDEHELMALADSCAERLNKRGEEADGLYKNAVWTYVAGAAAVLLGGILYLAYAPEAAQSVYVNSQRVLEALSDVAGQPYAPGIQTDVSNLMSMAGEVYAMKDQLSQVRSVDEVITAAQSAKNQAAVQKVNEKIRAYIAQLRKVQQAIPGWVAKIQAVHSTTTESSNDWLAKLKGLVEPFYNTDAEDVIESLYGQKAWMGMGEGRSGGLYEAIKNDIQVMSQAMNAAQSEIQQRASQLQMGAPAPTPAPAQTETPIAQAPVQMPTPTPAPAPTAPAGGPAAARTRPEGFGGLPEW